jgi:hypothetical protein
VIVQRLEESDDVAEFEGRARRQSGFTRNSFTFDKGAVGGVEIGENPDCLTPLQLGVHGAHTRITDHDVVVVPSSNVCHRHLYWQPFSFEVPTAKQ